MKKYRIVDYTPDMRSAWNDIVERSENGTIFHRMDFLDYHPEERFTRCDVLLAHGGQIIGVMPLSRCGHSAMSPFGGSFGGPAFLRMGTVKALCALEALKESLLARGIHQLTVALPPPPYAKFPDSLVEYCMLRMAHRVSMQTTRVTSIIDLQSTRSLSQNIRRNIRKAVKKGVDFEQTKMVEPFYNLLCGTLKGRHGSDPTHTRAELAYLTKHLPGKVVIHLARYKGEVVAGILCMVNASPCALAFYNCHDRAIAPTGALAALFMHVADKMRAGGKRYLDLGSNQHAWQTFESWAFTVQGRAWGNSVV